MDMDIPRNENGYSSICTPVFNTRSIHSSQEEEVSQMSINTSMNKTKMWCMYTYIHYKGMVKN